VQIEAQMDMITTVSVAPEENTGVIDAAELLKNIPGANVSKNGPMTSIVHYRGMSGDRVNVVTDGVNVKMAGPNAMDPAISHLPASLVDEVGLHRGIAPVSSGIETIGGSIEVKAKSADFAMDEKPEFHGDVSAGGSGVDSGKKAAVFVSGANQNHKAYLGASSENGDSFKFPAGENFNTEYDRSVYLLGYGFQSDDNKHQFNLTSNYNDTGKTGTPALPMDIEYARGGVVSADYTLHQSDDLSFTFLLATQDSDHLMNNYMFRDTTAPDRRFSTSNVISNTYKIAAEKQYSQASLKVGIQGDTAANKADIFNPDNTSFKVTNYDTERNRNSVFAQWSQQYNPQLHMLAGLRYSRVDMNAGDVTSSVAMMSSPMGTLHKTLQDRFNASDRHKVDNNIDVALTMTQKLSDSLSLNYGIARKTRSPSYQERYLWLPLESTSGLADGRQYFGNINLKPENATQLELGATINTARQGYVAPHIYYHRVNDYIQGTPTTTTPAPANTLTFNNVDAELYGMDVDFNQPLTQRVSLDGTLSYVRGKRRDITDNLYRITPLNVRLGLHYNKDQWSIGSDVVAYAHQNQVSATNDEQKTAGYALLNLQGDYTFKQKFTLSFGIDNLLDKDYRDHLNGYNRNNLNTDVGFDSSNTQAFRLPGPGRNIYASLAYRW
jgi:iron complex outermembrane receptor protein